VAAKIGLPLKQVFKTLVARPDRSKDRNKDPNKDPNKDRRGICMAVIPGDQELNLKALASAAGERKIQLVPVFDTISISAGVRGLQILIAPAEYLRATQGTIAALAEPKRE
jgi:Cys-tRNA(Pro)/Cys-tRNA(Cys) deacylase